MKNPLPIFALVVVALIFALGLVAYQSSLMEVYDETNQTAETATLYPYQIEYGWFAMMAIIALIIAIGFVFWHFWG